MFMKTLHVWCATWSFPILKADIVLRHLETIFTNSFLSQLSKCYQILWEAWNEVSEVVDHSDVGIGIYWIYCTRFSLKCLLFSSNTCPRNSTNLMPKKHLLDLSRTLNLAILARTTYNISKKHFFYISPYHKCKWLLYGDSTFKSQALLVWY